MTANKEPSSFRLPKDSTGLHFQNWLHVATRELSEDTKARIVSEVTDHFDAACADLRANGVEATSAYFKVLDSLGDPEAARATYALQDLEQRHSIQRTRLEKQFYFRPTPPTAIILEGLTWLLFFLSISFIAIGLPNLRTDATSTIETWELFWHAISFGICGILFRVARYRKNSQRAKLRVLAACTLLTTLAIHYVISNVDDLGIVHIVMSLAMLNFAHDQWALIRELPTIPIDNDAD